MGHAHVARTRHGAAVLHAQVGRTGAQRLGVDARRLGQNLQQCLYDLYVVFQQQPWTQQHTHTHDANMEGGRKKQAENKRHSRTHTNVRRCITQSVAVAALPLFVHYSIKFLFQ